MKIDRKNSRFFLAAIVGNIFLFIMVFHQLSDQFFIFDDFSFITNNPNIRDFDLEKSLSIFTTSLIPIPYHIWGFIGGVFGFESALPFKSANLILHLINTNLVIYFCRMFMEIFQIEKHEISNLNLWIASITGGLFYFLHPTQAESIAWASCLKDVLSTSFSMTAICYYLRARKLERRISIPLLGVLIVFAFLTKPNVIVVIPMILVMERFLFKRKISKKFLLLIPIIIGFVIIHLERSYSSSSAILNLIQETNLLNYSITIISALGVYMEKTLAPLSVYFFTQDKEALLMQTFSIVLPLLIVLPMSFFYIRSRKMTIPFFVLVSFIILVSPNIGIINNYFQQNFSIISSRYFNLPLISISLLISSFVLQSLNRFKSLTLVFLTPFIAIYLSLMIFQLSLWKTSSGLLEYSAANSAPNKELYAAIAAAHRKEGNRSLSNYWNQKALDVKKDKFK